MTISLSSEGYEAGEGCDGTEECEEYSPQFDETDYDYIYTYRYDYTYTYSYKYAYDNKNLF